MRKEKKYDNIKKNCSSSFWGRIPSTQTVMAMLAILRTLQSQVEVYIKMRIN